MKRLAISSLIILIFSVLNPPASAQEGNYDQEFLMVQSSLGEGNIKSGRELVNTLVDKYPDSSSAWFLKSQVEKQMIHYREALSSAFKALSLKPGSVSGYYIISGIYDDLQLYDKCILYCDSILNKDSTHLLAQIRKAQALVKNSDIPEALGQYHNLYSQDTMNIAFIKKLGSLYSRMDSINDAISWYSKAVMLDSADISSYTYLGNLFVRGEKFEEGLPVMDRGISIDSTNSWLYRFRGSLNIMNASLEDAEKDFKRSIELGDSSAFTFRHLGLSLYKQSKYNEALPVYQATLKLDPEDAQAWYYLGFCYKWQENMASAIESMEKSLRLSVSPGISSVYNGLAQFHAIKREYDSAMLYYSRAYEWDNSDPVPLAQMGMLVEQTGGTREEAKSYYELYLEKAGIEDIYLMRYVRDRLQLINEKLFMEGKLDRENE